MSASAVPFAPPPPPPTPSLSSLHAGAASQNRIITPVDPKYEIRQLCTSHKSLKHSINCRLHDLTGGKGERKCYLLCHYKQVTPKLQDGPMCGLVAACMAGELLMGTSPDVVDMLEEARSQGYTKQGEMFTAQHMCNLAQKVLGCSGEVICEPDRRHKAILSHALQANPVLIPYDADSNHEPCLKQGRKAHWTIITGVLCVIDTPAAAKRISDYYDPDDSLPGLYHVKPSFHAANVEFMSLLEEAEIFVFTKQGKSQHTALWPLQSLLDSNSNLVEYSLKLQEDADNYVLPPQGMTQTLRDKIVCLYRTLPS